MNKLIQAIKNKKPIEEEPVMRTRRTSDIIELNNYFNITTVFDVSLSEIVEINQEFDEIYFSASEVEEIINCINNNDEEAIKEIARSKINNVVLAHNEFIDLYDYIELDDDKTIASSEILKTEYSINYDEIINDLYGRIMEIYSN
jgi:hypothetical protein